MKKSKYKYVFSIGGITIGIDADTQSTNYALAWKDFLYSRKTIKKPEIQLTLKKIVVDRNKNKKDALITKRKFKEINFQENINWRNAILNSRCVCSRLSSINMASFSNAIVDVQKDSVTIVDFITNKMDIFYTPDISAIMNVFFKEPRLIAHFLPAFSSVLFHCAGVIRKDRVAVFFAPDEGGKTTVIKNLSEGICLSDDHLLIKNRGKGFIAYGTPWGVYRNHIEKGEIGGVFILKKSDRFQLNKLTSKQTLEYIWNEHLGYYGLLSQNAKMKYFEFLVDFCKIPSYLMLFSKEFVDWTAIDKIIEK